MKKTCKSCKHYDDVNRECGFDSNLDVDKYVRPCESDMSSFSNWEQRRDSNGAPITA